MTIDYDPFSEEVRNDPLPIYKRLRDEDARPLHGEVRRVGLLRFQDIWDASSNSDALCAAKGTTPAQLLTKDQPVAPMLNVMDPPSHTQLRSVIRKCFLPQHVRAAEPVARKMASPSCSTRWPTRRSSTPSATSRRCSRSRSPARRSASRWRTARC